MVETVKNVAKILWEFRTPNAITYDISKTILFFSPNNIDNKLVNSYKIQKSK